MKRGTLVLTLVGFVGLLFWACNETSGPTGSTKLSEAQETTSVQPLGSEGSTPGVVGPTPTECELIELNRASIKSEVDCKLGVRFYLEAPGATYFNVHLNGLNNGPILGPNTPGQWSEWYSLKAGSYTYTAAAEAKVDGKTIQCDHHNKTFKVPKCKCVKPTPPACEFGPAVYSPKDCTWTCPPCVMPEMPKCQYGPAQIDGCGWKCPPCVLDDPPFCPFGPAIPNLETCSYSCPPCTLQCQQPKILNTKLCVCECPPPGQAECPDQVYNNETCQWEGDCYECDMGDLTPKCYSGNIGNAQHFFNRFGICMKMTHKTGAQNKSCTSAKWNADAVVVKGGPGFRLYTNVKKGNKLCTYCPPGMPSIACKKPNISHIGYFKCNENAVCR